jgi:hypothetical protein
MHCGAEQSSAGQCEATPVVQSTALRRRAKHCKASSEQHCATPQRTATRRSERHRIARPAWPSLAKDGNPKQRNARTARRGRALQSNATPGTQSGAEQSTAEQSIASTALHRFRTQGMAMHCRARHRQKCMAEHCTPWYGEALHREATPEMQGRVMRCDAEQFSIEQCQQCRAPLIAPERSKAE